MKVAVLLLVLVAVVIIPEASGWGRFRFRLPRIRLPRIRLPRIRLPRIRLPRIRLPRIRLPRIKKIFKVIKVFRPILKAAKKITSGLKKLVKGGIKGIKKVVKISLPFVAPLLQPLQKKICTPHRPPPPPPPPPQQPGGEEETGPPKGEVEPPEEEQTSIVYEYVYVTATPEPPKGRAIPELIPAETNELADNTNHESRDVQDVYGTEDEEELRAVRELEETLDLFHKQGMLLHGLHEVVRDESDVEDLYTILNHHLSKRGIMSKIKGVMCSVTQMACQG